MKKLMFSTIAVLILFSGCSTYSDLKPIRDYIVTEKDLIPEGICVDSRSQTIYVSSTYKRKIIRISRNGSVSDFIQPLQDTIGSVIGMLVDERSNLLWVNSVHDKSILPLVKPEIKTEWSNNIYAYNLKSGTLEFKFALHEQSAFLNDLTITTSGQIFATETIGNSVYTIDSENGRLQLFLSVDGLHFLNGITFSAELNCLFVSANEGIVRINLNDKSYQMLKTNENTDSRFIDGLTFYKNTLLGHQSSKIEKFHLTDTGTEIFRSEVVDSGKEFDSSTTGDIADPFYYYIVNSQIRSGIDYNNHKIRSIDSLDNYIIRRKKL